MLTFQQKSTLKGNETYAKQVWGQSAVFTDNENGEWEYLLKWIFGGMKC